MDEGTLKKKLQKKVESWEKICGYVAGEGEFENRGQEPLGSEKKAKKFWKFFSKNYMVSLVGPVVKPFGTTVKKEEREKVEKNIDARV